MKAFYHNIFLFLLWFNYVAQLCQKGIKVTVVCPGPIETSNGTGATTSEQKASSEVAYHIILKPLCIFF